jgi:signal transduction histidine kinase
VSQYTLLNQPPKLGEISLDEVLDDVRASVGPLLRERGATLVTRASKAKARGNQTLMIQVLQNLVVNGLTYNRSPAPQVKVTVRNSAEHCHIAVEDNGLGIEAEYIADIFKPLVRLHTAAAYPGSGLGLTLARKAVLAQKGAIWCQSVPGQGSIFHVRVPAAHRSARRRAAR